MSLHTIIYFSLRRWNIKRRNRYFIQRRTSCCVPELIYILIFPFIACSLCRVSPKCVASGLWISSFPQNDAVIVSMPMPIHIMAFCCCCFRCWIFYFNQNENTCAAEAASRKMTNNQKMKEKFTQRNHLNVWLQDCLNMTNHCTGTRIRGL